MDNELHALAGRRPITRIAIIGHPRRIQVALMIEAFQKLGVACEMANDADRADQGKGVRPRF